MGPITLGKRERKNVKHPKDNITDWQSGKRVHARIWTTDNGGLVVREFAETEGQLQPLGESENYFQGWLKITGCGEDTNKKSENLFLDPEQHGSPSPGILEFDLTQQDEYNTILTSQIKQGQLPVPPTSQQLQVGDLVWLKTEGANKNTRVKRLVRVQIPRTPYKYRLGDYLEKYPHLHACKDYDTLCPACRAFGWVDQLKEGEKTDVSQRVAYAGRIRLSNAQLIEATGRYRDITLSILSSPKPTKTQFYLLNTEKKPDSQVNYKSKAALLRGRKFYRHHKQANSYEYVRPPFETPQQNGQNRTITSALAPNSEFEFTIHFENLARTELGALLWSIELEDGMFHRLGYGKPLGLGSVKLKVSKLKLMDWNRRMSSLTEQGGWTTVYDVDDKEKSSREVLDKATTSFTEYMEIYYEQTFSDLKNELQKILSAASVNLPIHYPRTAAERSDEGKNFEWFESEDKVLELVMKDQGLTYDPP